jgi:hypothetical protein
MPNTDPATWEPSSQTPPPLPELRMGITQRELGNGRCLFEMELGTLGRVAVLAAPAPALTDGEWHDIVAARESYRHMWGGRDHVAAVQEDPFDGRAGFARFYRTTHYIATVTTSGKPAKIITMRKVAIHPSALGGEAPEPPLVEDVAFWQVYDPLTQTTQPLGSVLQAYLERDGDRGSFPSPAHLPIAALSRSGTLPYERNPDRHPDERNRTAVAYALIQVAALAGDTGTVLYVAQICEEFRTRAFALHLPDGGHLELAYAPTAQTLRLPAGRAVVRLDRANPVVQRLLLHFPGFWLDNAGLARLLARLVETNRLQAGHFLPAALELMESPDAARLTNEQADLMQRLVHQTALARAELQTVARLLAKPRLAKYLIELLHTHDELARHALAEVPDGPYSATLDPQTYWLSVLRLLRTAREIYT